MRNAYTKRSNARVIGYAVVLALFAAVLVIVVQDIDIPTEKVSHAVAVNIEE